MYQKLIIKCVFIIISVISECIGINSNKSSVKSVNKDVLKAMDLKLDLSKFNKEKIEIHELNDALKNLFNQLELKLNETELMYKKNDTKIYIKTFHFNIDFEKGTKIELELSEEISKKTYLTTPKESNTSHNIKSVNNVNITQNSPTVKNSTQKLEKHHKKNVNNIDKTPLTTVKPEKASTKEETDVNKIKKQESIKGNEILKVIEFDTSYYYDVEDNSTDYPVLDYIEMYKDTTNEYNVFIPTEATVNVTEFYEALFVEKSGVFNNYSDPVCLGDPKCQNFTKAVYPWIASIFIKTDAQNSQFSYYCDGVLISERVIITDARCLYISNSSVKPDNVLLFLGKANLQAFGSDEKILKANQIILHPNFTSEKEVKHDLALLVLEDAVELSEKVQTACFHDEQDQTEVEKAGTTSWALNGEMMPIFFETPNELCFNRSEDIFCATYGYDVPLCPNYGGIYATKRAYTWCLQGIRFGDPADRGVCYTKNVFYTSLKNYKDWIQNVVDINKNDL